MTDIINKHIMYDKLSAAAAGKAVMTLKTRNNMNSLANATTASGNESHKSNNKTVTEQRKPLTFVHDFIWFDYKQRRVMNNRVFLKDWAVHTIANDEWSHNFTIKSNTIKQNASAALTIFRPKQLLYIVSDS